MSIKTEIIQITPALAQTMLDSNTHNRHIDDQRVYQYANAMKRGEWMLNGDSIVFSNSGVLLDGQHRLLAVIKSKRSIRTLVVRGVPDVAQETMDQNKKRSLNDMLKLRGEKNTATLASSLILVHAYATTGVLYSGAVHPTPSPQQLMHYLEKLTAEQKDLRNYQHPPYSTQLKELTTPSLSAALFYLFSLADEYDAREFLRLLATGDGIGEGNPIYTCRSRLLAEARKPQGRIIPTVRAALTVKAWNAWQDGRTMHSLRWAGGGGRAEDFPVIRNCPIVPGSAPGSSLAKPKVAKPKAKSA